MIPAHVGIIKGTPKNFLQALRFPAHLEKLLLLYKALSLVAL